MSDENKKTVLISSDHAGFELKRYLVKELETRGYNVTDLGPDAYNPNDDYPDYAQKMAKALSTANENASGILICRNGVGISMTANRSPNVRCALSWSPEHIKSARNDDDVNCLALPADYLSQEIALQIALAFLETPFSIQEKHVRRLAKYGYTGNSRQN